MSMIEILDKDNSNKVEDLLFCPLLISYHGSGKKYLSSIDESKPKVKEAALTILSKLDEYHSYVKNACNIKELQPSQAQRESYFRLHNQRMNETMKDARKNSTFLSLVNEFVVLYGESFANYNPELSISGNNTRQESTFHKIEHSIEYPNMDLIDPHGLDYMLRVFRCEQLKHEVNH